VKQTHCLQAKLAVEANKTWSDEAIRDNAAALAAAELAWVMTDKGLKISASTAATGKVWDNVPGGRTDAIFAFSSTAAWNPNDNIALSASFAYTNQASSPSTFSWDGYRVLPQVRATLKW
jgi:hypothetical protein